MMNYIWSGIFAVSILFGILNGRMTEVANALLQGGNEAIQLVLSLLGAMCLWNGLMKIAEQSGLTDLLAKIMRPVIDLIMPGLKRNGAAIKAVCMNAVSYTHLKKEVDKYGMEAYEKTISDAIGVLHHQKRDDL